MTNNDQIFRATSPKKQQQKNPKNQKQKPKPKTKQNKNSEKQKQNAISSTKSARLLELLLSI